MRIAKTKAKSKSRTRTKSRAVVSRSFGVSSFRPNTRMQWLGIALFAVVAGALLYRSFANPLYSTSPKDIVLQYVQPHNDVAKENRLSDTHFPLLTLYGNGLLVCGTNDAHEFTAPNIPTADTTHDHEGVPTARTLSKTEMSKLIENIRNTGFEQLDPEYFEQPISEQQYTVRLVTKGSEKTVLYYNDIAPPAAYTQTLTLMKDACAQTTQPYISDTATLRARVDVDTAGQQVNTIDGFDQEAAAPLKNVMNKSKAVKRQNQPKIAANQEVDDSEEQLITVSGAAAQGLQKASKNAASKFVNFEGSNYEISVDPELPTPNNPLNLDYNAIRAKTDKIRVNKGKSVTSRILDAVDLSEQALAVSANSGYRVVLLLPSSGGSTANADKAQSIANNTNTWACKRVGQCPVYKGFSVIRGSQTQAYYNTCHNTCGGNQLYAIYYNVAAKDAGTIYRSDVATIVIPGWKTNTLSASWKACGLGGQPGYMAVVDLYQTDTVNGYTCKPLNKTFAHEWFHNLGLGHNGSCTKNYLMDGPPGCSHTNSCAINGTVYPICILTSSQSTYLKNSTRYN